MGYLGIQVVQFSSFALFSKCRKRATVAREYERRSRPFKNKCRCSNKSRIFLCMCEAAPTLDTVVLVNFSKSYRDVKVSAYLAVGRRARSIALQSALLPCRLRSQSRYRQTLVSIFHFSTFATQQVAAPWALNNCLFVTINSSRTVTLTSQCETELSRAAIPQIEQLSFCYRAPRTFFSFFICIIFIFRNTYLCLHLTSMVYFFCILLLLCMHEKQTSVQPSRMI